jgi:hypothetical protein
MMHDETKLWYYAKALDLIWFFLGMADGILPHDSVP